jgi:membrane-associated phospholipid phosphatase
MKTYMSYLKNGRSFILTSILFLFFSYLSLFIFNPELVPLHKVISHLQWLNVFFINVTFIGDAYFSLLLALFMLFYFQKYKLGLKILSGLFITLFITQLINNLMSPLSFHLYFENGQYLIPDNTFLPDDIGIVSSHTALGFSWAIIVSNHLKTKLWHKILFTAIILLAFSRLYLAPTSFLSVTIGATVGIIAAFCVYCSQYYFMIFIKKSNRLFQLKSSIYNYNKVQTS